jgi:anti-anti-sigma regulatory factor
MSGDVESSPGDVLQVEARYDDTEATILLGGEFDMTGVARFWGYLSAVLAPHPLSITVDASCREFIDSSGLMALVRARDAAAEAGVAFRVRARRPYCGASPSFAGSRICCGPSNSERRAGSVVLDPCPAGSRVAWSATASSRHPNCCMSKPKVPARKPSSHLKAIST